MSWRWPSGWQLRLKYDVKSESLVDFWFFMRDDAAEKAFSIYESNKLLAERQMRSIHEFL
ncbi:hypothetical protein [Maribacter arenosus]|uniref:Uncharacterized protein n=1 Tax=Maribacter arenosus TaxID=1854708 RepID=A0ABR7VBN0_9FLAO|nr:hypothetical protein [Maribacter arenosus]MBD0849464.1 hypothetical protein [Maribacter arenosus]